MCSAPTLEAGITSRLQQSDHLSLSLSLRSNQKLAGGSMWEFLLL